MKKKLRIFIIAGEVSGDVLGAKIMSEMPDAEFVGIGGEHMAAAGLRPIFPISDLAVMGVAEVLAHAKTLTRRISETAAAIENYSPDIVLSIDSPGFVKRVIKKVRPGPSIEQIEFQRANNSPPEGESARQCRAGGGKILFQNSGNIVPPPHRASLRSRSATPPQGGSYIPPKFYHVVAPQVWAWGPWRAKKFAQIFDRLYAFFDFEVPYFTKYGLPTIAVGHPTAAALRPAKPAARKTLNITFIPGSRMSEVKKLLPVFKQVAEKLDTLHSALYTFSVPTVETTDKYIREQVAAWRVQPKIVPAADRYKLFEKTDIAVAAAGTVTAELAMLHIPAIVAYKMNPVTTVLARIMVRGVKWVSLVSILLGRQVYPELLGGNATPEKIIAEIRKLESPDARKKMISELASADKLWRRNGKSPAALIADDIIKNVKK